jgi:Asp-tRNA(Asn)/Glu-tRNA(Gln) amidotransferase C subunit
MDFLWHKVSEKEKEEIKKQAKSILDDFSKKLGKIELGEGKVERSEQTRDETKAMIYPDFRERFFENAPNKDGDWIKAEKGAWKQK